MDSIILAALLAVTAAMATAVGAVVVARRRTSGQIGTSDAATLWEAAELMRKELRDEVVTLRAQAVELRGQVSSLLDQIDRLEQRLATYERPGNG